ncbi:phospholipase D1 [Cavenderia fasciculata]|uniref:phospholipase D n=1 Tax=Cavenderia fasciculata TaxID=261658 RepID=F4QB61_CACFS|nr:phospholipase D1 [Cavenderia fasciculata]EGG14833.1 phospholipase D1 [Cavenderia fasciculata]|eukprot:XP_004351349.1 phospholipase D1 [Cavenderia fasciculata]
MEDSFEYRTASGGGGGMSDGEYIYNQDEDDDDDLTNTDTDSSIDHIVQYKIPHGHRHHQQGEIYHKHHQHHHQNRNGSRHSREFHINYQDDLSMHLPTSNNSSGNNNALKKRQSINQADSFVYSADDIDIQEDDDDDHDDELFDVDEYENNSNLSAINGDNTEDSSIASTLTNTTNNMTTTNTTTTNTNTNTNTTTTNTNNNHNRQHRSSISSLNTRNIVSSNSNLNHSTPNFPAPNPDLLTTSTTSTTSTTTNNNNNNNNNNGNTTNRGRKSLYQATTHRVKNALGFSPLFMRRTTQQNLNNLNHPSIQRTNSTILEKYLYKKTYFSREELHRLYNIFKKEEISNIDFSEFLIFQGLSFLVHLPHGVDILTKLILEYDEMLSLMDRGSKSLHASTISNNEEDAIGGEFDVEGTVRQQLEHIKNFNVYSDMKLNNESFSSLNTSSLVLRWRTAIDGLTECLFTYMRKKYAVPPHKNPSISQIIDIVSIMTRGTYKEKSELVFKMCKKKSEDGIYKSELMELVKLVDSLTVVNEFGYGNIGTPDEIVNNIFKESYSNYNSLKAGTTPSQLVKESSKSEQKVNSHLLHDLFLKRSSINADVPRCFGYFDLIYACFVKPIEINNTQSFSSWLYKVKYIGVFKYAYSLRYFDCRDGFLIAYKRLRLNKNVPSKVICLFNTSVKVLPKEHPNHHKHGSILKTIFRTGNKEIDESKDATDFVLELNDKEHTFIALSSSKAANFINSIRSNSKGSYRFHSYASPRDDINVDYIINGQDYFKRIYHAIKNAKNEIFIAGWCISPTLTLVRGEDRDDEDVRGHLYRLDHLLYKKAAEGVKIYILIWDETIIAGDLGSRFVKSLFEKLHSRNIKVVRHPHLLPLSWSHHQKIVVIDQSLAYLGGMDLCFGRYDTTNYYLNDNRELIFPGADYINSCVLKPKSNEKTCVIDRKNVPRMPWHDVSISIDGLAARDVATNFIQRWNHAKNANRDYKKYPYLIPTSDPLPPPIQVGESKVQIVRSVSDWSAGQSLENSIYKAYINLINMSQYYIYIQNQFFISSTGNPQPNNQIAFAIMKRIEKAIILKEIFKVIILIPIHSEGDLFTQETQLIVKWTLKSVQGIINELNSKYPHVDVNQYMSVNSLRNWGTNGEVVFTEQIYIHSKLMIVDDRVTIIGSANINDRSLNGSRDSEICAVIEDREIVESRMNGQLHMASHFSLNLRCQLWESHLGLQPTTVIDGKDSEHIRRAIKDPLDQWTYDVLWRQTSKSNTDIYQAAFGNYIPENCTKISQYTRDGRLPSSSLNQSNLEQIQGYLVDFPFKMLIDDEEPASIYSDIITEI